ncbi:anaphase promoting complex subunit 5 PWA37_001631 [Arxiozyma heterogenica]|uniref:anaphase promoting complex subunit 5 n=1 Tax=Arxiozyma heterogenica TaxID=278026 RepID=UPI002F037255
MATHFTIKSTVPTPYDVCILIIIYFHVSVPKSVSLRLFLRLISSSVLKSTPFNPIKKHIVFQSSDQVPLFPSLDDILEYLIDKSPNNLDICLCLCKSLISIRTIDQLFILQCILSNRYNDKRISYLGNFVSLCSTKLDLSTFDDRLLLLYNLKSFIKKSKWIIKYSTEIDNCKYNFISNIETDYKKNIKNQVYLDISNTDNYHYGNDDKDLMIDTFKSLINKTMSVETSNQLHTSIILSDTHFQNIINYQIELAVQGKDKNESQQHGEIDKYFENVTLNDITMFPSIHILKYFIYINEKRYQDALYELHSYYDYILARNGDKNFHISLLHLGVFHSIFGDSKSPMASFEEAFKIARENRDIKTLNYIHLTILRYMEDYPKQVISIRDRINKIIDSLQRIDGQNNSQIFEGAYRADTLFCLKSNKNLIKLLESNLQYLIISLQQDRYSLLDDDFNNSIFYFYSKIWRYLGYTDISDVYELFYEMDPIDKEIRKGFELLNNGRNIDSIVNNMYLPTLKYDQEMYLNLLRIKKMILNDELDESLRLLNDLSDQCLTLYQDNFWHFKYVIEICQLLINVDRGPRALPILAKLINETRENKNSLHSAQCLLLLCHTLVQMKKYNDVYKMLIRDLDLLLQFDETKNAAIKIFTNVVKASMIALN